jgi:mRNA interferase RelE/StbE
VLRIDIADDALAFLLRLPPKHAAQIDARILRLAAEPHPPGCVKLHGTRDVFRVRQGPYRVLYRVRDADATLVIESIGDRKDIYR